MGIVIKTPTYYQYNEARLINLVDGDTFDIELKVTQDIGFHVISQDIITQRFRVKDFDAPETFRPRNDAEKAHGEAAKVYATQLLARGIFIVRSYREGAYDRWTADIFLSPSGDDFATLMKAAGMEKRPSY